MGLIMLLENESLLAELSKSILVDTSPELRLLALRLIQSLTMQISTPEVYENITQSVSISTINTLLFSKSDNQFVGHVKDSDFWNCLNN